MADLRALAHEIGWGDAATYIQSGNLVFSARGAAGSIATKLEREIAERFGFPVDVIVRSAADWSRYAAANPFPAESERESNRVFLVLSRRAPRADAVAALRERASASESIEGTADAIWIHYPAGVAKTKLQPALVDRLIGSPSTARNWRTVIALRDLSAPP